LTSEIAKPMSKFECKQTWQKTLATKVVRRPHGIMAKASGSNPVDRQLGINVV